MLARKCTLLRAPIDLRKGEEGVNDDKARESGQSLPCFNSVFDMPLYYLAQLLVSF